MDTWTGPEAAVVRNRKPVKLMKEPMNILKISINMIMAKKISQNQRQQGYYFSRPARINIAHVQNSNKSKSRCQDYTQNSDYLSHY